MQRIARLFLFLCYFIFLTFSAFAQQGSVKGRVMSNGRPVEGAQVKLYPGLQTAQTTSNGTFSFSNVDSGSNELVVRRKLDSLMVPFSIGATGTVELKDISFESGSKSLGGVTVSGGRIRQGSDLKAYNMTKASDKIITVVSAETIKKMPDKNAADAMQRVAGAAVEKSKGEGNNVSLRGTPTDWTATLINGNRLPTANEDDASRIFDFQLFPASLIEYIVVTKSVTPDMEADNIGGAINFLTRSAVTERTLNIDIAGGYSVMARKPSAEINILAGNVSKNKKWSYLLNGSYYGRAYAADAPVLAYGTNFNHSLARLELKKYTGERHTAGVNAAVEFKPSEKFKIGVKYLQGYLQDQKWQQKTMYNWSDGSGARIRLQNIHGILINELYGGELNSEWKPNDKFKLTAGIASYSNRFHYGPFPQGKDDPRNGYTTVEFISPLLDYTDKINTNFFGGAYDPNNTKDPNPYPYKLLDVDNPYRNGGDHYTNIQPKYEQLGQPGKGVAPEDYYLSGAFADQNTTWERDPIVANLNGSYKISDKLTITAGGKYRMKEGARSLSYFEWRLKPGVSKIPLTDFETMPMDPQNNYLQEWGTPYTGTFMPFLTRNQMHGFFDRYQDSLLERPMDTSNNNFQDWLGSQYQYTENVAAGYVMANAKLGRLSLVGGLRVEHTSLHETSDTLVEDFNASIGVRELQQTVDRKYLALLPALNANYAVNSYNNVRAAVSRTFHRPNFEETKPGAPIWQRESFLRIYGNPNLRPTYSLNLDVAYEHFWGSKGMWSIGGYYKNVTDHIFVASQQDDRPFNDGIMNKTFLNASTSFVAGLEAMIDRRFDFLPGVFSGFGINANLTLSYSEMQVPGRPKKQAMTEQAPVLYNVAVYYERKKLNARLGLNYRGAFVTDVNMAVNPDPDADGLPLHLDTDYDLFMGEAYSLDFQVAYRFTKHFSAYVELNNLTDAPYRTYVGRPERPLRTEYYRQKGMLGLKFQL